MRPDLVSNLTYDSHFRSSSIKSYNSLRYVHFLGGQYLLQITNPLKVADFHVRRWVAMAAAVACRNPELRNANCI